MRNDRRLRIMTAEGILLGKVAEGVFVFKGIPYAAPPGDVDFAERVSEYWLNFAREATTCTHSIRGELDWPAWHSSTDQTLRLGRHGLAEIAIEKRFMRYRMRVFRFLIKPLSI
ncbi:hypothetical protein [Erwinia pyrifoliae]|uniref:hypothetical protein n=1 Tax=Erwinia pyrifoliae TaxID=79967 RepID=UPI002200930D|nr:hypothetical protein [Erwinia pyrifoliae]UWS31093.1 hypothetical protein NYP81_06475 [Erwinia pyrifoliae]